MTAHAHRLGPALVLAGTGDNAGGAPLFILGSAGEAIWHGLREGGEPGAVARLIDRLGIDATTARREVEAAKDAWRQAGLLGATPARRTAPPGVRASLPPVPRRRIYALCGRPIAVHFAAREVEALVAPRFAWSERPHLAPTATLTVARSRRGFLLREAGRADVPAPDAVTMSGLFTRRFAELSHGTDDWLMVLHAAAVGDPRGAVVLPGPNGTGKSSLTAALVAGGYGYHSDDCVPVAGDGRVMPVPFAVCHKARNAAGGLRLSYTPPPGPPPRPMPPRLFLFPRYRAGARPEAHRLTAPEVLARLVAGRAWLSRRPADLRRALALLADTPAWEITYPSTDAALALLADLDGSAEAA